MDILQKVLARSIMVRLFSDGIVIMYLGGILELGETREILENPLHPYTRALLSAVPSIRGGRTTKLKVTGEIPDASNIQRGCRFNPDAPSLARSAGGRSRAH